MTRSKKKGKTSDIFSTAGSHRNASSEVGRVVDISGNSLATVSKHSKGSLGTYQKPKKRTKAKRR